MPTTQSATADPRPRAGLIAGATPIPLEGVSVEAELTGFFARVVISQRYRNRESQPVEAVYVFPLDEGAAVCGFEAIVNGTHYVGEVKPRDEAFKAYDVALQEGHGAYLLDEERPDVFTASVGNVPPGGEVLLRLTYVTELALEGDAVRFSLPTTVSPRYAPPEDRAGVGRSEQEALNPPVMWKVPYGLSVTVTLDMPGAIRRVESPSHPIAVTLDASRGTVTLAHANAALDRDLVVLVDADGLSEPRAFIERDAAGRHAAAIVFRPTLPTEQAAPEVVFLVDRSGSMGGTSIAEVRNALQLCLRSLPARSRFNIVGFGSTFERLFPESEAYDEQTLEKASAHVAALDADLGGTEILQALEFALTARRLDMPGQVVVLTDGEVTNTDAVLALARQHASATRVFTFGIGRGASAHLVRGLARAGNGAAEFIYPGERAEAKVLRQFARLLTPAVSDVKIDWGGLTVTPAPTSPPPVFAGERLIAYGLVADPHATTVTLTARGSRGVASFPIAFDPATAATGTTVATLAARMRIRELEESPEWLTARGSRQADRKRGGVHDEIVRLGTTYGLVSRETSFVAIERRDVPVQGEAVLRRIPVALTSGWGGVEEHGFFGHAAPASAMPFAAGSVSLGDVGFDGAVGRVAAPMQRPGRMRRMREAVFGPPPAHGTPEPRMPSQGPSLRPLDRLVSLQRADGSWELTADFAEAMQIDPRSLEDGLTLVGRVKDAKRVWATALALAWLERHAAEARGEWMLLARKAEAWLADRAGDAETLAAWREAAKAAIP